jgi:hypothetical protein
VHGVCCSLGACTVAGCTAVVAAASIQAAQIWLVPCRYAQFMLCRGLDRLNSKLLPRLLLFKLTGSPKSAHWVEFCTFVSGAVGTLCSYPVCRLHVMSWRLSFSLHYELCNALSCGSFVLGEICRAYHCGGVAYVTAMYRGGCRRKE